MGFRGPIPVMPDSFKKLAGDLEDLADLLMNQELMNKIGLGVIRRNAQRTRRGVDAAGRPFVAAPTARPGSPYSPGHARRRTRRGLPTDKINFQFTLYGGSLEALNHVINRDLSDIHIMFTNPRAARIMAYHNVSGAGRSRVIRETLGLNAEDISMIETLVGKHADDALKRVRLL